MRGGFDAKDPTFEGDCQHPEGHLTGDEHLPFPTEPQAARDVAAE